MPIVSFPLGPLETNCHVICGKTDAVAVDPGGDMDGGLNQLLDVLKTKNLKLQAIVCTHFHFDHIYGVATLHEMTGATIYGSDKDSDVLRSEMGAGGTWGFPPVKQFSWTDLKEGPITFGEISMEVMATPGHTPGSLSLYVPSMNAVLTGDLLFYHSVGRTDFPGSSPAAMVKSLHKKIFILPPETEVFPGHGPNTNVGEELANNPYLWL